MLLNPSLGNLVNYDNCNLYSSNLSNQNQDPKLKCIVEFDNENEFVYYNISYFFYILCFCSCSEFGGNILPYDKCWYTKVAYVNT